VNDEKELSPELKEFINGLILPRLVDELFATTGHLYSAAPSYYHDERPFADVGKEAA
jgi:hypothetical protein